MEKYLNITIITNIVLYFSKETIYSRQSIFYYKIQILNICEKLLNKTILYKDFNKNKWNNYDNF